MGLLTDPGLAGQAAGASGPHNLCGLPRVLLNNSASPGGGGSDPNSLWEKMKFYKRKY